MNKKFVLLALLVLLLLGAVFADSFEQQRRAAIRQKIRPELLRAVDAKIGEGQGIAPLDSGQPLAEAIRVRNGKVKVLLNLSNERELENIAGQINAKGGVVKGKFAAGKTIAAEIALNKIEEIAENSAVKQVWPDFEVTAAAEPLQQIHAQSAWELNLFGQGAKIAVLDTGIDEMHPALAGKVIISKNFSGSATAADLLGHGTHVAGIIAGSESVQGIAPEAKLLNAKVLDDNGSGTVSSVIAGINWAIGQGADVINLSLGAPIAENDTPLNQAVRDAISQGVAVVIAAGNCGYACPGSSCNGFTGVTMPGNTVEAITVGAVDAGNNAACFSGNAIVGEEIKPDLMAPGVLIVSAVPGGTAAKSGTSMAAPFASGAAALLLQQNPEFTPMQVKQFLEQTGFDLGEKGEDALYGWGLIDLSKISADLNMLPDQNTLPPGNDGGSTDVNFAESDFTFSGPNTVYKMKSGEFSVWHQGTGSLDISAQVEELVDVIVEFIVLDEFGNVVDRYFVGPKEYSLVSEISFDYSWMPQRTGNFTVKAIIFKGGIAASGMSSADLRAATAEKIVRATVPADAVKINWFNAPNRMQEGENAGFLINATNNGYLDENIVMEIRFEDEARNIFKVVASEAKQIAVGQSREFALNALIDLPDGNYSVKAIVFFEDRNVSVERQTTVFFPANGQAQNLEIPANIGVGSELQGTVEFANNTALAAQPLFFGQVLDGNEQIGSIFFDGNSVEPNTVKQYDFAWKVDAMPKQYTLRFEAQYNGNNAFIEKEFSVMDMNSPVITNAAMLSSVALNQFNPIRVKAFDETAVTKVTAMITTPSVMFELELKQIGFDQNSEWSAAFTRTEETGDYSVLIRALDAYWHFSFYKVLQFTATAAPSECAGKNVLAVASDNSFTLDYSNEFNWLEQFAAKNKCTQFWKKSLYAAPDLNYLRKFNAVIWATGNRFGESIDENDSKLLIDYVNAGDRLLLEGSDIASEHLGDELMQEIAHAAWNSEPGPNASDSLMAFAADSFMAGQPSTQLDLNKAPFFDTLSDLNNAKALAYIGSEPVMTFSQNKSSNSKAVFSAIAFNALNETTRNEFLDKLIAWLLAAPDDPPTVQLTFPNYANAASNGKFIYLLFNVSDAENKQPLLANIYLDEDTSAWNGNERIIVQGLNLFNTYRCRGLSFSTGKSCNYYKHALTPIAQDGKYYVLISVNDGENNAADYSDYPITIDSTAPKTTLTQDGNTITITCNDGNGSGCQSINSRAFAEKDAANQGMVLYYKLDEDNNSIVTDYSLAGNNGTIYGSYKRYNTFALNGKSLYFNGNAFIQTKSLEPKNKSITAWVYGLYVYDSGLNSERIIAGAMNGNKGYYLAETNTQLIGTAFDAQGNKITLSTAKGYGWRQAALVHDSDNNKIALYLNGVKAAEKTINGYSPANTLFTIGRKSSESSGFFKGYLDEVALYSTALNEGEIKQMFEREKNGQWKQTKLYTSNNVAFALSTEGNYKISYYSQDKAGNKETEKNEAITIGAEKSNWWNAAWKYKRAIQLPNQDLNAGTTIRVPTNFNTFTGIQPDCDDARIIDENLKMEMPRIIEACGSSNGSIFLMLNNSIKQGQDGLNATYAVYYGNDTAIAPDWNGKITEATTTKFETGTREQWQQDESGAGDVNGEIALYGKYSYWLAPITGSWNIIDRAITAFDGDANYSTWIMTKDVTIGRKYFALWEYPPRPDYYVCGSGIQNGKFWYQSDDTEQISDLSASNNTWYKLEISYKNYDDNCYYSFYDTKGDVLLTTKTTQRYGGAWQPGKVNKITLREFRGTYPQTAGTHWDNITFELAKTAIGLGNEEQQ